MDSSRDPCIDFGRRLRELRLERGLSQERLAHRSGLDRTYISSCEAGRRNVTLRTIHRIADALGVEAVAIVGGGRSDAAPRLAAEESAPYGPCD